MKTHELRIRIYSYESLSELPAESQKLVELAKDASQKAWAPYSKFKVGAALKLENGEFISGNNQENVAYPSGLCAERVALFYAGSQFPGIAVEKIALAAFANNVFLEEPVFPCGDCRQVLLEHENRVKQNIQIIMYGTKEIKIVNSIADLLPLPFDYDLLR